VNHFVPFEIDVVYVFACLLAVDFITGFLHWAEDTWTAPGASKLLDRWIVRDNIEHHRKPGLIRAGDYWGTNKVCIALAAVAAVVLMLFHVHAWQAYLIVALLSQSNQVHLWAHSAGPPRLVRWLQRLGILQSRAHHGVHHKRPYASRFCTTTNYLNPVLDGLRFWRGLEWLIVRCGVTMQRATPAREGY
jgi:plasmanylethanolamine desaturase